MRNNPMGIRHLLLATLLLPALAWADPGSRLWATGGVTSIEGSAGGGIGTWALLSGYASDEEWSGSAALTRAEFDDYSLSVKAASLNWQNRLELSVAHQTFGLDTLQSTFDRDALEQAVYGAKLRLFGDVLYDPMGQWSLGVQHKRNQTFTIPRQLKARDDSGTDVYLAVSKLFFSAFLGRNLLLNGTLRGTKANQAGLLGFGGDDNNSYQPMIEGSIGVFATRQWLVGAEYRQKPDNLAAVAEDDWWDLYIAWFPDRRVSVTAAWAELGDVGGLKDQSGPYVTIQANF